MPTLQAPSSRTAAEMYAVNAVRELNLGRCSLTGLYGAGQWCHRVAEGRGGPKVPANGLWLDASAHAASHSAAALSRRAGWMIDTPPKSTRWTFDEWSAYVRQVPALCLGQGAAGWYYLDASGDGMAALVDPEDLDDAAVQFGLDPTLTLPEALAELTRVTGWRAA